MFSITGDLREEVGLQQEVLSMQPYYWTGMEVDVQLPQQHQNQR